jgi:hypothetical protein
MNKSDLEHRVDDLLQLANRKGDRPIRDGLTYDDCDLDDPEVEAGLREIASVRPLTLDDLDLVLLEVEDRHRREMRKRIEEAMGCHERRDDLKVFYVYNTADRKLTILAKDAACAREFAFYAGHVKERLNARVVVLRSEHEMKLRKSGDALGRALRDGKPGVVKHVGENVVMEGPRSVFTPMSLVPSPPERAE